MNSAFVGYEELSRPPSVIHLGLLDLLNSSYPTQPHSLIANYKNGGQIKRKSSTKHPGGLIYFKPI